MACVRPAPALVLLTDRHYCCRRRRKLPTQMCQPIPLPLRSDLQAFQQPCSRGHRIRTVDDSTILLNEDLCATIKLAEEVSPLVVTVFRKIVARLGKPKHGLHNNQNVSDGRLTVNGSNGPSEMVLRSLRQCYILSMTRKLLEVSTSLLWIQPLLAVPFPIAPRSVGQL